MIFQLAFLLLFLPLTKQKWKVIMWTATAFILTGLVDYMNFDPAVYMNRLLNVLLLIIIVLAAALFLCRYSDWRTGNGAVSVWYRFCFIWRFMEWLCGRFLLQRCRISVEHLYVCFFWWGFIMCHWSSVLYNPEMRQRKSTHRFLWRNIRRVSCMRQGPCGITRNYWLFKDTISVISIYEHIWA